MDIKQALERVVNNLDLSTAEMQDVMRLIMTGQCSDAQIGAFLMGMRMKSETIDEIVGAVQVMRELAAPVSIDAERLVDTCGTGGDGMNIFNVSSAAAFVVPSAGGKVAKHGNRAVSGKSGSADVLEAAGIYLDLTPEQVARCIETVGVGFMFAPAHHGAMRHAAAARRERDSATSSGVSTNTSMNSPGSSRALAIRRSARKGEMNETSTISPASTIRRATSATRRMFSTRSASVKPRSRFSPWRTLSPSST